MDEIVYLLALALAAFFFLYLYLKYFIRYKIDDGISIYVLGFIRILKIPSSEIGDIYRIGFAEAFHYPHALWLLRAPWKPWLLVRRTKGLFRCVAISPDNTDDFLHRFSRDE